MPLFLIFFLLPQSGMTKEATPPHEVGGFVLGSHVTDYPDIEYSNFLKDVVVYDWHGFEKGIISYGICEFPGEIVRIKLKYADSSKKFFDTLLDKYKDKYGKPDEWKGDSFGVLHVWKWKFVDKEQNRIHLILQHNNQDPNENIGNMVKLYYPDRIELEHLCFTSKCASNCNTTANQQEMMQRIMRKKSDWNYLIPK